MCSLYAIIGNLIRNNWKIAKFPLYLEGYPAIFCVSKSSLKAGESVHQQYNSVRKKWLFDVSIARSYSKSAGKPKKGATRVEISEADLAKAFDVGTLFDEYKRVVDHFKEQLIMQLSVRTTPGAIEEVKVKYDGDTYAIRDLAQVARKGGKEVILEMGVFMEALPSVMEALRKSPLGVNPVQEGNAIIIQIPKVTKERREEMVKSGKALLNKCKIRLRDVQNKHIKKLENIKSLSDDDIWRLKMQLTSLCNKHVTEAEEAFEIKEKDLLSTS